MNPDFLKRVRLFEQLSTPELAEILMLGAVKEYKSEEVIFEDGSPGESFFLSSMLARCGLARCTQTWGRKRSRF